MQCGNCHWGINFPDPGPLPAPARVRLFWGLVQYDDELSGIDRDIHDIKKEKHETQVSCFRFPQVINKSKNSICGEWKVRNAQAT